MTKARVCHISTVHPIWDTRVFVRECGSLAEAGYDVHIVIGHPESGMRDGVHVHPIPTFKSRYARMLVAPWYALNAALKTRADLYHYHDPELIWMAFILRWFSQKPVVFDIHESIFSQVQSKPYLPAWLGWLLGCIYRIIETILTFGQEKIVANANSVKDYSRPVLVQNFPKHDQFAPTMRFEPDAKPLLVYVGGVTEIRGAFIYLELARRLVESGRQFNMEIIGGLDSDEFKNHLDEINRRNDTESFVAITGPQDWDVAMRTVSEATIGLCLLHPVPNYKTCLSTKIIEYMMLGTPILASDFDCWRPFVTSEQTGCMVDPMDDDDVFNTCVRMLDNVESLKEMSRRGPIAVKERYTWDQEFAKLKDCYARLLGE